jgi:protocatechuate 3,4-dioxygenase beta subunit
VTGRVVDGQGAPVPAASVMIVDTNGALVARGYTGRDGEFRFLTASPADGVEWSLAVRISDRDHLGPLMGLAPVATLDHVRGDGPPLTIVVRGN